jgi:hypothetical protein
LEGVFPSRAVFKVWPRVTKQAANGLISSDGKQLGSLLLQPPAHLAAS